MKVDLRDKKDIYQVSQRVTILFRLIYCYCYHYFSYIRLKIRWEMLQ